MTTVCPSPFLSQISLSSSRVFRFGDFWDGYQTNLGAPTFDKQLPDGAHVLGFFGTSQGGSLGITFAVEVGAVSPPKPYTSALDAVSIKFLLDFYKEHIKPLDDAAKEGPLTTGQVVTQVIMHATRKSAAPHGGRAFAPGQGRRYVELIPEGQLWSSPKNQQHSMFFASHGALSPAYLPCASGQRMVVGNPSRLRKIPDSPAPLAAFLNPFKVLVDSLEAHFTAAGAIKETGEGKDKCFVWLDIFGAQTRFALCHAAHHAASQAVRLRPLCVPLAVAINQHDPGVDLERGATLRMTIERATSTLVVLDEKAAPLGRLWCLCAPSPDLPCGAALWRYDAE